MGYSFQLAARVLLYASSHRQEILCYTSRGALAGTKNSLGFKGLLCDPQLDLVLIRLTTNHIGVKRHLISTACFYFHFKVNSINFSSDIDRDLLAFESEIQKCSESHT